MESQEYPLQHFQAMAEFAGDLRRLSAQILEHGYNYSAFGSWWTTLQRQGVAFRIVFDGKEQQLRLERAGTTTGAQAWEALNSWAAADDQRAHALREVVARLRSV